MSRTDAFNLTIDPAGVEALASRIALLDADRLGTMARDVVNDVTTRFDAGARKAMNAGIALDDAYISSRMTTVLATSPINPAATISALGPKAPGRAGLTILGHYGPKIVYGGVFKNGKPKPKGVQVEVTRGKPKVIPGAFLMTLRQGTAAGDKVGVFIRDLGKVRHLYAVAPYSLFRHQIEVGLEALTADLEDTMETTIETFYGKVFG